MCAWCRYRDARHDAASVFIDLLTFWPKLRKGGIMSGHDFRDSARLCDGSNDWLEQSDGRNPEAKAVRGAVVDFAVLVGRQLTVTWGACGPCGVHGVVAVGR